MAGQGSLLSANPHADKRACPLPLGVQGVVGRSEALEKSRASKGLVLTRRLEN